MKWSNIKMMNIKHHLITVLFGFHIVSAYVIFIPEETRPGEIIFNSSVYKLGSERHYRISNERSAPFVQDLIGVDSKNGEVTLLKELNCRSINYPAIFTVHVESTSDRLRDIDYYSVALRIFVTGDECHHPLEVFYKHVSSRGVVDWVTETYASFAIPTTDKWRKICLRKSQFVNSIKAFLPKTINQFCKVDFTSVSDDRFQIEKSQSDLVARDNVCILEPLWKVIITFYVRCEQKKNIQNSEHKLKIVYHHQKFNDTEIARRVRRELKNQSPFFEQHLYVAGVLEECDPGVVVTTVKARDPENSPITYSMSSLLDARTQSMFDIDIKTGVVTTKVKLDRELVDVHYFRVTAIDDSFPPRTGTTMLQINVLDANDHSPVFEMNEYDASVRESVSVGSTVITLKATDQDVGKNAEVEYSIVSVNGGGSSTEEEDGQAFKIDGKSGVITTRTHLDREVTEIYTLIVQASDMATPQSARRSSSASVVIRILDDNDNYPQFSERTYTVLVDEDIGWADNPVIAHIKATDADQGNNAAIRYAIIGGNVQSQFSIDTVTGDVSLVKPLDYEVQRNHRLVIRAQDGGSPARSNTTQLLVNVKDVNDNAPRFYTSLFQESVSESVPAGYSIVKVQAYDADEGANADVIYSIAARDVSGGSTGEFPIAVDSHSGSIYTTKELDREEQSKYVFQVIAMDQGVPPQSASASVVITVQDVNDNDPVFEPKIYEAVVSEDDSPGTPVATVTATDVDEDARLHYELTNGNVRGRFAITSQNGKGLITVAQPLDYKQEKRYVLTVTASDSGGRTDTATVYVNVSDANNFAPVFENAPYSSSVFEDAPIGTTVIVVSAVDNDVGINAQITYSLGEEMSSTDHTSDFTINPQTGAIITLKPLDREVTSGYLLTVTAKDGGMPSLSDTTDVEITVVDVNDNFPVFKQAMYSGSVLEDALIGTSVVQVSATDADVGLNGRIRYTLSEKDVDEGSFLIDPTSGVIRTNKGLDRESRAVYELEAFAVDRGSPALSSSVPVIVKIEDINDSPPAFDTDKIVMYIPENSPIGSTVGELHAKDPDEGVNAIVSYSIIGGDDSQSFTLITRPLTGKAELLTMTDLDYESAKKKFDLIVRAASPPLRSDVHVEVIVTDVNDNAPVLKDFHVIFNNFHDCFPTGPIGKIPAYDADVSDRLHYRILSGNNANLVALNESTGMLQLSPQLNTNVPKLATMEVSVTDGINDVKAIMQLTVILITDEMLLKSITVRLNQMTKEAFLSPLLNFFIDGLAAIIPCPKENIFLFSIQDDTEVKGHILNVSFSVRRPDVPREEFYSPQFLQEKVYLNRAILAKLSTVQVLPFDDNLCVREPCINFEECVTVLKFGNASNFIGSDTVLFRPIYPMTTFTCKCPQGFTGSREHYLCDTEVNLCYSQPCQNNGSCKRAEGGYTCICPPNFTGVNCEIKMQTDPCNPDLCKSGSTCSNKIKGGFVCEDCSLSVGSEHYTSLCELKTRSFTANSFLTFPGLKQRYRFRLDLRFATRSRSGLLLYNGRYNEQHDFIALEIVDANLQFSFSLGSGVTRATASIPGGVADGEWHSVAVSYYNKTVVVSIDDCDTALALKHGLELRGKWNCAGYAEHELEERCASLTETCHRFLDLTGPLQLGGLPALPATFQPKNHHFEGCISDFRIDNRFVDLNAHFSDNGTTAGCPEKKSYCKSRPCRNEGVCSEGWATYKCECVEGYGGKDCSEAISSSWKFSGDGMLSFNPLLRSIQLPWLNTLTVRTLQQDAFLMSVQVGQNSSSVISLKSGFLLYTYNGISIPFTAKNLSDGKWHQIEVTWLGTEIKLATDYSEHQSIIPFTETIQGLYVGKILIGGPDATYTSLNSDYGYLDGCVRDVRIGNQQQTLSRPTVRENVQDGCGTETDGCRINCPPNAKCMVAWGESYCQCTNGHVGMGCLDVCGLEPCENAGVCIGDLSDMRGYKCRCNSTDYSGDYCEEKITQPCPAGWWGYPVCGPCSCDVEAGYNPDCHKTTGSCHCRENHYQPNNTSKCIPCDCYLTGSYSAQCNHETGQCRCRDGVIGLKCDSCPNPYAEVTLKGCEVVYDGCPRSAEAGIWWPRTNFDLTAIEQCPKGSTGKASRLCDDTLGGWQQPDLFNCTSDRFLDLRNQLALIESGELHLHTFVAIKLASDLQKATNLTQNLYGADVLISFDLISALLSYESTVHGLNLTHSQDKDYVYNIVHSSSVLMDEKYSEHWEKIDSLIGKGVDDFVKIVENYINILASSQHDTYTKPFEVIASNMVLGLDIVTQESLYGYESDTSSVFSYSGDVSFTTERVVIPDTSQFLENSPISHPNPGPLIAFPKYNNYLQDRSKFDTFTKVLVPLKLLGINQPENGDLLSKHSSTEDGAVISYAQYKQAGMLFPEVYDASVIRRWGVDIVIGSPLISVSILVPEYVQAVTNEKRPVTFESNAQKKAYDGEYDGRHRENEAYFTQRYRRDKSFGEKLFFRNLSGVPLKWPIRLQMLLVSNKTVFNERSNPQCVHWSTAKGFGEWSRVGCRTDVDEKLFLEGNPTIPYYVNCTCNHLSTFAILVDVVDLEYIPEPSLLEDVTSYSAFAISLPLLLATYLILAFIKGAQTNSNAIRQNLVLCIFLAELLFFIALKARKATVHAEFACKLIAICLHYLWLSSFSWMLVDAIHLYRMFTEMRDINHGPMRFYYSMGYVLPAVVVSLSVGVRAHQYGNFYFCWMSLYESVIWSLVGPVCTCVVVNIVVFLMAVRAAFTLQDHVLGFGNLRSLLWVSVVALPLLGATWVLSLLTASENMPLLTPCLSVAVLIQSSFSLAGYCFANVRVRQNLIRSIMWCLGKKVPLLETTSVVGIQSTSTQNINAQSRSALAYRSASFDNNRRNIGISTSSTTSRSTTKTSSSPYRSDAHLRNTSTSTSNYNSTSDVPSYMRGLEHQENALRRHRDIPEESERRERRRGDSDSDSDGSEGRSLELASSHSSDDDESSVRRNRNRTAVHQGYLPNITEHVSRCGTPPSLNVVTNSQLFPAVKPMYGSRWSSHLPESYLTGGYPPGSVVAGRWSAETGSDNNELYNNKKGASPNPLPTPDGNDESCQLPKHPGQYTVQAHYDMIYGQNARGEFRKIPNDDVNFQDYAERCSDVEEKHNMADKYLFPYTAEEDHLNPSHGQYFEHPEAHLANNDIHHSVMDYQGSIVGSRMGSVCGSVTGSPSPLMPPVSMMHSAANNVDKSQWCWEYSN